MGAYRFDGAQKTAILLLALGQEIAADVFRNMSEAEIKRIATAMSRLGRIDQNTVDSIIAEFQGLLERDQNAVRGGDAATRRLLDAAFRDGAALGERLGITSEPGLPSLQKIPNDVLVGYLAKQRTQTTAVVFAYLEPSKAAQVFAQLPRAMHDDLLVRIARMESVSPEVLDDLESDLAELSRQGADTQRYQVGGIRAAVDILNAMGRTQGNELLSQIDNRDPSLAEELKSQMFRFDDLGNVEPQDLRTILKTVSQEDLRLALRKASSAVANAIFNTMSDRAAEILREDIAAMQPVPLSEVEAAQQRIAAKATELEEQGLVSLNSNDVYV